MKWVRVRVNSKHRIKMSGELYSLYALCSIEEWLRDKRTISNLSKVLSHNLFKGTTCML